MANSLDPDQAGHFVRPDLGQSCFQKLSAGGRSGPDWSCGQDQIGLFLKIDLVTGNHVSQYYL